MLQQTLDKLYQMKLNGMVDAAREQFTNPAVSTLSFEGKRQTVPTLRVSSA